MVNKKNTINNTRKRSMKKTKVAEEQHQQNNNELPTTNYKFKLGFDQSVSSGVISIHGECYFDYDVVDAENSLHFLRINLQRFESDLTREGYLVASKHAPKRNGESKSTRGSSRGNHNHACSESDSL
jgi:hypothetical protein